MSLICTILIAALLPSAYVNEIPDAVRTEDHITIVEARSRLIARHGERIFFRVKGTIVADKPGPPAYFILLDKTAASEVLCSCDDKWQVGDEISAICTAMQPECENPTLLSEVLEITVLRHQTPTAPRFIYPVDLSGHRNDFTRVTVGGVVIDAFCDIANPDWTILVLAHDDEQTMAWTRTGDLKHSPLKSLVDAEVQVTGIVLPDLSNFYRAQGPWLLAASPDALKITSPPPEKPFDADASPPHRQTFTGRALACWKGNSLLLATSDNRRIRTQLAQGEPMPAPGDVVTVSGFLRHNQFCTRLSNALCRFETNVEASVETPVDTKAQHLFSCEANVRQVNAKLDGLTIRLVGVVQEIHAPRTDLAEISLATDQTTFPLWIGRETPPPEIGSQIEAVGVCLIEDTTDMQTGIIRATGLSVALRSPADLRILASPPWWTPARLAVLVAILVLVLVAILAWNAILRKIIVRRSRELAKETIRSASATLRLEERTRLAVELHDTVAQNLTGASFEIKTVTRLAATNPEKMMEHLEIVDRTLKSCRDDLRNCIWDLRANSLDQKDLNQAIALALNPHVGNATLKIRFNVPRTKISEPTLHALMRIVRELAINAVRHGHASEIRVAGGIDGHKLVFSVRDNGCGFDPDKAPGAAQGHFGLQGILERVRKLNGTLTIDSAANQGTRVAVHLNLHNPDNSQQA